MKRITEIKTEAQYERALKVVEALMDAEDGSKEEEELERLSVLVSEYEDEHYDIPLPTVYERGQQIAYIPTHAEGDINHPDVEFGFVTKDLGEDCFCRYWSKYSPGELRTKANSERTPKRLLVLYRSHLQGEVEAMIRAWVDV